MQHSSPRQKLKAFNEYSPQRQMSDVYARWSIQHVTTRIFTSLTLWRDRENEKRNTRRIKKKQQQKQTLTLLLEQNKKYLKQQQNVRNNNNANNYKK